MSKPKQMETLLRHAQGQEQHAQAGWLKARQKSLAAQDQLAELQRYAQDYSPGRVSGQLQAGALLNHHYFSDRLKQAVLQQGRVVQDVRAEEARMRESWQHRHRRLEAIRLMQQRRQAVEQKNGQRQEQRRLDEFSTRGLSALTGAGHA